MRWTVLKLRAKRAIDAAVRIARGIALVYVIAWDLRQYYRQRWGFRRK